MDSNSAFILQPKHKIWVFSNWVSPQTRFLQHHQLLQEDVLIDLNHLDELQLVKPEQNIIDFYTHEVLATKGSTVLCIKEKVLKSDSLVTQKTSYLFSAGDDSEAFKCAKEAIDNFLDLQMKRLHKWEYVTIYRPCDGS